MVKSERQKLEEFLIYRDDYIDLLEEGAISKEEFNEKNHELIERLNLRPFSNIANFQQGMYNYHYYNTMAKTSLYLSNKYKDENNLKKYKYENNNKLNYYNEKDKATRAMVELAEPGEMEAYYIKLHSKNLKTSIFEIYFKNKKRSILHSKSGEIKQLLIDKNCFVDDVRTSRIDSYVNNG